MADGYIEHVIRQQSAAIPYRRKLADTVEVLLVTSRRQRRWILPKGNIKRGMLPHTSAAHEAFEEGGVLGVVNRKPIGSYSQVKVSGQTKSDITIRAFPLLVNVELNYWPEKAVRDRRWMSLNDAINSVNDAALRGILETFADGLVADVV